ncbi:hypothetical protein BOTBODRAFT_182133 [Botryobasidium botryosum FD-172 SS1]|uniref:Uncharacterized protein n=1 Tax=Botryobasidium botryosum (strain FD-172 SS1) TaxID=930990 RepID=A0A067M2U8_BOTB1|nr:hypothetical protein BOTBODRAFT_182133 [Botryobasidium botryosum FD-172 SS1]
MTTSALEYATSRVARGPPGLDHDYGTFVLATYDAARGGVSLDDHDTTHEAFVIATCDPARGTVSLNDSATPGATRGGPHSNVEESARTPPPAEGPHDPLLFRRFVELWAMIYGFSIEEMPWAALLTLCEVFTSTTQRRLAVTAMARDIPSCLSVEDSNVPRFDIKYIVEKFKEFIALLLLSEMRDRDSQSNIAVHRTTNRTRSTRIRGS